MTATRRRDVDLCHPCAQEGRCRIGVDDFRIVEPGTVVGEFRVPPEAMGREVAHGGWTAWVFDEFLGYCAETMGDWAVTSRLTLDYRRPVPIGADVVVTAHGTRASERHLDMTGEMRLASSGALLATATGLWIALPDAQQHYERALAWAATEGARG